MGILNVGMTGLNSAQAGLLTTSHNIANASTPGYSRQEILQTTNVAIFKAGSYVGAGSQVNGVRRHYDEFLGRQVMSAEASASEMESFEVQISQIDGMLANSDAGLSFAMNSFFKGVQDVASNPTSVAARQSMLSAGESLASRFQGLDRRLSEIRDSTNQQVPGYISQINGYSAQIADINDRITFALASGGGTKPNDLLDQREQLLKDLNKLVRVTAFQQTDGSLNVFIGSGQAIVMRGEAVKLAPVPSIDDSERITVGLVSLNGDMQVIPESQVTGGSLGGLLKFRSQSLDAVQNSLGRIALTLGQNFNDQHKLGQDLTGALGQDFFSLTPPQVIPSVVNTGTGAPAVALDTATIDRLTVSDYKLSYIGGNYQLLRIADNQIQTFASLPQTVDGFTITAGTWVPNANDTILIKPTRNAAHGIRVMFSEPRLVAAAAPVRTTASGSNTGTARISSGEVSSGPPVDANLKHKVNITFTSATSFDVFDATAGASIATGVAYVAGNSFSYNGWKAEISGNPASGDVFTVESNVNGVADSRNAVALGALQTRNMMGGTATSGPIMSYLAAYSQLISAVGAKTNEVAAIGAAQQGLADQANQTLQSVSGVNLDEEAANLLRYQQAYQAAAKIIEIAGRIFDEVLALGR